MDFTKTALALGSAIGVPEFLKSIEGLKFENALDAVGLELRPSTIARLLPAAGLVVISAAVGAGIALLLAPSSGTKLRARLTDGLDEAKHRLSDRIQSESQRRANDAVS